MKEGSDLKSADETGEGIFTKPTRGKLTKTRDGNEPQFYLI